MNLSDIEITEVTVHYGETKSLPEYSNVKPAYSLTAKVRPGQDPAEVREALATEVKRLVWEDCDVALERKGRKAHFYNGPRYDALSVSQDRYIAIVPSGAQLPGLWAKANDIERGWRLEALQKYLQEYWNDWIIADFSAGNVEELPELRGYEVIWKRWEDKLYCLILPGDYDDSQLPTAWGKVYSSNYYTRLALNFLPWITKEAASREAILIDCLDGDLSKLPNLETKQPEPTPFDDSFDERTMTTMMTIGTENTTMTETMPKTICYVDIETMTWFDQPEVARLPRDLQVMSMAFGIGVTWESINGDYKIWRDGADLFDYLLGFDIVAGWNISSFDLPILAREAGASVLGFPRVYDLFAIIKELTGRWYKLDDMAKENLGRGKTSDGLQAAKWLASGDEENIAKAIEYCRNDVTLEMELGGTGPARLRGYPAGNEAK